LKGTNEKECDREESKKLKRETSKFETTEQKNFKFSLIDRLKKNLGVDYFSEKKEKILTYKQVEKLVIYFQNHFHVLFY